MKEIEENRTEKGKNHQKLKFKHKFHKNQLINEGEL
jgi:hypothetical protein